MDMMNTMDDSSPLSDEQLLGLVREALVSLEDEHIRIDRLSMDATLTALGVDSMNAVEMAAYLEDRLGIRMPDDQISQVSTVRDMATLVRRYVGPSA